MVVEYQVTVEMSTGGGRLGSQGAPQGHLPDEVDLWSPRRGAAGCPRQGAQLDQVATGGGGQQ